MNDTKDIKLKNVNTYKKMQKIRCNAQSYKVIYQTYYEATNDLVSLPILKKIKNKLIKY